MQADLVVKGIIFNRSLDKILLLQRSYDDPTGANTWENAGGNMERGERPEEAIKREVREETGLTDIEVRNVAYVTLVDGPAPYLIMAYLCVARMETVSLSHEHQAFRWADQDECRAMLPKPIVDDFASHGIFELFHSREDGQ